MMMMRRPRERGTFDFFCSALSGLALPQPNDGSDESCTNIIEQDFHFRTFHLGELCGIYSL